jgi:hypothetical protein
VARGQDLARRGGARGGLSARPLDVLVQDRLEAEAALALAAWSGVEIELVMLAGIGGPAFLRAIEALLGRRVTADCDDRAGLAMEAMRCGLSRIVVAPAAGGAVGRAVLDRLADIGRQQGAEVLARHPGPLYGLAGGGRRFVPLHPRLTP